MQAVEGTSISASYLHEQPRMLLVMMNDDGCIPTSFLDDIAVVAAAQQLLTRMTDWLTSRERSDSDNSGHWCNVCDYTASCVTDLEKNAHDGLALVGLQCAIA